MENNTVFKSEPTTGWAYHHGWKILKDHFTNLLVVTIIYMVVQSLSGFAGRNDNASFSEASISFLIWLLIGGPVVFSSMWVYLKASRGDEYEIKDAFACFSANYFEVMLANFLVTVIIVVGFVFLIIPGIIFAVKLVFVPYLVMDKEMKAMDAIKLSWKMTGGYFWQIFLVGFLAVFIVIAGLVLLIIGIFPAVLWINTAMASLYMAVDEKVSLEATV